MYLDYFVYFMDKNKQFYAIAHDRRILYKDLTLTFDDYNNLLLISSKNNIDYNKLYPKPAMKDIDECLININKRYIGIFDIKFEYEEIFGTISGKMEINTKTTEIKKAFEMMEFFSNQVHMFPLRLKSKIGHFKGIQRKAA